MGADFIDKTRGTFLKARNQSFRDFTDATLFDRGVRLEHRTVLAKPTAGEFRPEQDCLLRRVDDEVVVLSSEYVELGRLVSPPADVVRSLREIGDCASGKVAKVHMLSGNADIVVR
ncbi:MAG: hypothetical protein NTW87_11440 [Planctomycetota bacterium]|nr:hypothetical protein [Planctomycetota bacterium]